MSKKVVLKPYISFVVMTLNTFMLVSCSNESFWMQKVAWEDTNKINNAPTLSSAYSPPEIMYQKVASSEEVTLSDLNMNNQGNQITIKPGQTINATSQYVYHCKTCVPEMNNQIMVGLAGRSAQACIYNGGKEGQGSAEFSLKVPAKPGKYDVRFRAIQAVDCTEALKIGWNAETSPSKAATIGTIVVSRKEVETAVSEKNNTLYPVTPPL